jgi:hypothetical protein
MLAVLFLTTSVIHWLLFANATQPWACLSTVRQKHRAVCMQRGSCRRELSRISNVLDNRFCPQCMETKQAESVQHIICFHYEVYGKINSEYQVEIRCCQS